MTTDDQAQEGNAGGAVEPTVEETVTPSPEPSGDPLDDIQDPEARAEAKKHRAIISRHKKDLEAPTPAPQQPAPAPDTNLKRFATNQAKLLVPDEVKEVWDELTAIPLAGFDPLDPASIASNMKQRFKLYEKKEAKENPAAPLQTSTVVQGTAGQTVQQPKTIDPKLPKQPNQWY